MYWLLYDISEQKKRSKLVQLCKDNGLTRMQKSCFFGTIKSSSVKKFEQDIEKLIDSCDCVYLIPISQFSFNQTKIWGSSQQDLEVEENCCFI